jgi:hypothetical protein
MRTSRGFFLLALCSGMGAAAHAQMLQNGAPLLVSKRAIGHPVVLSARTLPEQASLPDAPDAMPPADDAGRGDESSSAASAAGEPTLADYRVAWRPLTGRERVALFWNDTYDSPGTFAALSLSALGEQIENKPAQWSADDNGYTRRFGSAYGQLAVSNVIHEGMAALSGLDPRYIPCGCQGIFRRSGYALKMSFVTFTESGRPTLDVPQLAGAYGSGMISTYWYPHRFYSPLVQGVQFGHEEMGEVFVENVFHEFVPDLKSALHMR